MPSFGRSSKAKLRTCHPDIQEIMYEVIEAYDVKIIFGHRSPALQKSLFKKGRVKKGGKWVISQKSKVVTYKDGYIKKSRHNEKVSTAIDVAPYPINWKDINEFYFMAGQIMNAAERLLFLRRIENVLVWGGRWKSFKDYPHFQLKKPIRS